MRIHTGGTLGSVEGRRKLKQRREPYWTKVVQGCALGYRKGASGGGTWIARVRDEAGEQHYHALGPADDLNDGQGLSYAQALERARAFFGVAAHSTGRHTVGDALDAYLRHLEANNPQATVDDARKRIEALMRPVLGEIPLTKLRRAELDAWRQSMLKGERPKAEKRQAARPRARAPETVNKLVAYLKAALNLARANRWVSDDGAWRELSKLKGARARKVFLTHEQARRLLKACATPALRDLVRAALLTGARSGELANLRARDFDALTGTLEVAGKTGARAVHLSSEAVAFFESLAKCAGAPEALLLPAHGGAGWTKNLHQKPFQAAVKAAELEADTVFYSLRHTHISWALLHQVNIQVVAENCGTSVRMIELHYGKFLRRDRRAMFDRLPSL